MIRSAAVLLLPAVAFAANPKDATSVSPIVNGVDAPLEVYPQTGALLFDGVINLGGMGENPTRTVLCTSTLIAPDVVLLAAHCLDPGALTFGFGSVDDVTWYWSRTPDLSYIFERAPDGPLPELPEDAIAAWDVVLHPEFDLNGVGMGLSLNYDIALMFLEEPVFIAPEGEDGALVAPHAYLPTVEEAAIVEVGTEVTFVGWGNQEQTVPDFLNPPPPGSVGIKQTGWATIAEVADYEYALDDDEGTPRKCRGDSGGPTFADLGTDEPFPERLIGVASHLYDDQDCAKTNVADTRVDYYLEWIDQEMRARCVEGQRAWCHGNDEPDGIVPAPTWADLDEKGLFACGCTTTSPGGAAGASVLGLLALATVRRRR